MFVWPRPKDWLVTGIAFSAFAAAAAAIGFASGLVHVVPKFDDSLVRVALVAVLLPAIGEEFVFRGVFSGPRWNLVRDAIAVALFVAWHPVNAHLFFPQAAGLFGDARFLLIVALLGISCLWLWRRTGSLWPPIAVHWLVVVIWKAFLDGPVLI